MTDDSPPRHTWCATSMQSFNFVFGCSRVSGLPSTVLEKPHYRLDSSPPLDLDHV